MCRGWKRMARLELEHTRADQHERMLQCDVFGSEQNSVAIETVEDSVESDEDVVVLTGIHRGKGLRGI